MSNLEELKELKKERKHCIIEYCRAKGAIVGYALLCSVLLSRITTVITDINPFSYKSTKDSFVIENYDSTGYIDTYLTTDAIKALDNIEIDVYTAWTYENGYYTRHKETYTLENTDELKNKLIHNITNITQDDLENIKYIKKSGYFQYAEKLDESYLNKGAYISMFTTRLGEKVVYEQSFEENLLDIAFFALLTFLLYVFVKEILDSYSTEYIECIIDEYDFIQNEINNIINSENNRKLKK